MDYMKEALKLAEKAYANGDIPVGAVIVKDGKIIAKGYNKKNKNGNPLCHAEIIAINKACKVVGDFRLQDCDMYVTKEPCIMCFGAILSARIKRVFYGASDLKYGVVDNADKLNFNHKCEWIKGVNETECSAILSRFFKELRDNNNAN